MRDTRQGHIKEEIESACVCCRQGLSISVRRKGVVETVGERPKEKK